MARGVLGLLSSPADLGIGAVPGAFEGGYLALEADQEFGGGGVGEQCGGEGCARRLGEESAVEIGLDAQEAALLPIGAEHGVDVEVFGGGFGAELAAVVGGEGLIIGGIFAGDDEGGGVDAVFESVEAGGGLALGGAGSGRFLRVGLIGRDLSGSTHDYDLARGFGEIWGAGRQVIEGEGKKEKMFVSLGIAGTQMREDRKEEIVCFLGEARALACVSGCEKIIMGPQMNADKRG